MSTTGSGSESSDEESAGAVACATLLVTGLASRGDGVGRLPDGRVVFVEGGVPGDRVELTDLAIRKNMVRARIGRLLESSSDRVEPRCSHFGVCGGCQWQHIRYEAQLEAKRVIVCDALERIGGLALDDIVDLGIEIIGSPQPYGYRARARLVESHGTVGYRVRGSREIQRVDECPVLVPAVEKARAELSQSVADGAREPFPSVLRKSTKRRRAHTEWLVTAGTTGPATLHAIGARRHARAIPESVSIEVLGERLRANAASFIQSNALLWEALAGEVRTQCTAVYREGTPGHFVELYAGIGFLTLPLARQGLSGVAIESDRSALADLAQNLESSGLAHRVRVIRGRVERRRDLAKHFSGADLLLIDPPRTGLEVPVRDAIASAGPSRLVYVSCDPATLARDLRVLNEAGYALVFVRAFDLVPQTPHVEVVARLERDRSVSGSRVSGSRVKTGS